MNFVLYSGGMSIVKANKLYGNHYSLLQSQGYRFLSFLGKQLEVGIAEAPTNLKVIGYIISTIDNISQQIVERWSESFIADLKHYISKIEVLYLLQYIAREVLYFRVGFIVRNSRDQLINLAGIEQYSLNY